MFGFCSGRGNSGGERILRFWRLICNIDAYKGSGVKRSGKREICEKCRKFGIFTQIYRYGLDDVS